MSDGGRPLDEPEGYDAASAQLEGLGALVREQLPVDPAGDLDGEGAGRLVRALRTRTPRARMQPRWIAAAAVMLLAGGAALWSAQSGELSYELTGSRSAQAGAVEAAPDRMATAKFSDGSTAVFDGGSSARVLAIDGRGAQLRLDSGRVAMHVVKRARPGRWSVHAGAYRVRVTGTRFSVVYQPEVARLEVEVQRGQVVVEGPDGPPLTLEAGERFSSPSQPPPQPPAAEIAQDSAPDAQSKALSRAREGRDRAAPMSWSRLVAIGSFDRVLELARDGGITRCLHHCPQVDLQALADAARYRQRPELAAQALEALRARFSGTGGATSAAFLLGRMAHVAGDERSALRWFDEYLGEASSGTFADEAMGRKLLIVARRDGPQAQALARQYLDRFPTGGHASHAQRLLQRTEPVAAPAR